MYALIFVLFATANAANFTPMNVIGCADDLGCDGIQHCINNACLPDVNNCIAKGEGGNSTGLGSTGGCVYNEECCEGLQCTRNSNDFSTCQ